MKLQIERDAEGWWTVEIPELDGSEYAKTHSKNLPVALVEAVPYIRELVPPREGSYP